MHKYKLAVGAIFKNESHIIREWLEHYINQNVEKFYLIDNGSTDDYMKEIRDFSDRIMLFQDSKKCAQTEHYNKYILPVCTESEWLLICDLDEFVYARKGYSSIMDYIRSVPEDVSAIMITRKMFGSSGYIKQPKRVVRSFTTRTPFRDRKISFKNSKFIVRTARLTYMTPHIQYFSDGLVITPDNKYIDLQEEYTWSEKNLDESFLHCNHYAIQSLERFMKVKATRGDVLYKENDELRNIDCFHIYDYGTNFIDTELKTINEKIDSKYCIS
jgi:predicted DNA-binding protein